MKTKHTPGPWIYPPVKFKGQHHHFEISSSHEDFDTYWIAKIQKVKTEQYSSEANAKLIAAAPELLDALQEFLDINDSKDTFDTKVDRMIKAVNSAQDAIKKATS